MSDLYNRMKEIEGTYLQPQSFKQYKNYWLPESIVKESKNVLSYGVHRDVGWEQAMCVDNQNLNINAPHLIYRMKFIDYKGSNNSALWPAF